MSKIELGEAGAFDDGAPQAVKAGDRDLVIVRRGEEFFAMRDVCPHQGAKLSSGYVTGDVPLCSRGEQPSYVRDGEFLACPWHGWKIDVRTGCSNIEPERVRVRNYPVSVENGKLYVKMDR